MAGILGYGVYLPRYRIETKVLRKVWPLTTGAPGVKEKSVANVDEDSLTMAVEASQNAMRNAGIEVSRIGAVCLGTVSNPVIDKSMAVMLAEVLGIAPQVIALDFGGSIRAGTMAFENCLNLVKSGRVEFGLVVGTDNQVPVPGDTLEFSLGAGASAFILSREGVMAEVGPFASYVTSYTSSWRSSTQKGTQRYDDYRQYREKYSFYVSKVILEVMEKAGLTADKYSQAAFAQPDGELHGVVARSLGFRPEAIRFPTIAPLVGDTGSSSALISLAAALDEARPGDRILVASFGSGAGSDAFCLSVLEAIEEKRDISKAVRKYLEPEDKTYFDYVQYEKVLGRVKAEWTPEPMTAFPASPAMIREQEYFIGLKAQKCKKCGSLNFPRRRICIEPDCRGREFEECPLPRRGRIETYYIQYVVYTNPEEGPFPMCVARLEGAKGEYGAKVNTMMTDFKLDEVKIGMPVELVFRRCGEEKGLVKYGYKFKPVKEGQ